MIYVKPRKVDPERAKRYIARTTPDAFIAYVDAWDVADLIEASNLNGVGEDVQMKIIFSLFAGTWQERMKIKHRNDPYPRIDFYSEYEIDYNRFKLCARYR